MNDKSQIAPHSGKDVILDPEITQTEEGYQAGCPTCHWTSGIRVYKGSVKILYYRHLEYVETLSEQSL